MSASAANLKENTWAVVDTDGPDGEEAVGIDNEDGSICLMDGPAEANQLRAEHIVACVQTCAGIPIEVLKAQRSGGLPWNIGDAIDIRVQNGRLREQRDELLTGLCKVLSRWDGCPDDRTPREVKDARLIVAKVRS